ncbi:choline/glycine/proline betaine transport protein [Modicisalibacter ilicicola DSM 19980]|uniref:Choline/glycine/proline betaine transport protein n=1 Tax=Modicisalibacter ilicicola DSM 19980 TaxID=1121942 RepID=A0A1M4ZQX4_9GAMM|nr:BCCT family transporter [Halomonas ilicicola]SHF20439.1 choline/glycine/proline betaine transport protein [Halomonas ilicicola DSM 19980]
MRDYLKEHTNPPVFIISAVIILAFVAWGVALPSQLDKIAKMINGWITADFGWWYMLVTTLFLIFIIVVMFSSWGKIRLGPDDSRPDWSTLSWFAMLFTAGMGIGLVFFGVAEPIFHFNSPPVGEGGTSETALRAMGITLFHWGLHPWAVYIVMGLSLGYFCFRKNLPMRPAAALYPLIGKHIYGPIGNAIDILAVFGTLFGLATSLGFGATQINTGLNVLFGVSVGAIPQVVIIGLITAVAVTSVMLGIDAGIRRLSVINLFLAMILAAFVFFVGPTIFILEFMVSSTGYYLQHLPERSFQMYSFSEAGSDWLASWTLFYWGWWISWSPFVGMFIARVSRGRTIRQFIAGTLLAPVGASIAWFSIFGGSAIKAILDDPDNPLADAGTTDAMFTLMEQLPVLSILGTLGSLVAILVVTLFFATSSDSGSLVVDMLTNGGDPNPIWQQRMFWAVLEGVVAAVLLAAGWTAAGDAASALTPLQTAAVASGLPFSFVLLFMCWGLVRGLSQESALTESGRRLRKYPYPSQPPREDEGKSST